VSNPLLDPSIHHLVAARVLPTPHESARMRRTMNSSSILAGSLALFPAVCAAAAPDRALYDLRTEPDLSRVVATDAKVTRTDAAAGGALRVVTGHNQTWPGITLPAPGGHWDLSAFAQVSLSVSNAGTNAVTVFCRIDNPGADGASHCVTGSIPLPAGRAATLRVVLNRTHDDTLAGKLFGLRGYPVAAGGSQSVDPKNITQLLVFVSQPKADHTFEIGDIRASGSHTPPTAWTSDAEPFFPFIDALGQYRHKDWPGKTASAADLVAHREREAAELATRPGPAGWDTYGGWSGGPQLEATGFFRTEKIRGKWWLVDPEGRLFFSQGIDCVRMLDTTPIDERESWFQNFPGDQPEFRDFLSTGFALKGHYQGRSPKCFSFAGANLRRKYGSDWRNATAPIIHQRLRSWGLNTIANWSDAGVSALRRTPYTDALNSGRTRMIEGSEGYWGKFPDVFDPGFAEGLRRGMEAKRNKSAGDAWCLGYFSDNEMSWGDEVSLAVAALKSPSDQPAKRVFLADLQARYGDIAELNRAWGTTHASWDALRQSREAPDPKKAWTDLTAFYTKTAEQYFRSVREAIKTVAPRQLYLGCRFAGANARAAAAAAKHGDVVSYNLYQRSVENFQFDGGADVPLLIGEFHFGALDRGLFHTGLVPVANQADRAGAYRDYLRGALRHSQFVGAHWFQYQDEPTTGRVYDEENYQIGFVDIADTPYPEMVAASRELAVTLYPLRFGVQTDTAR
jgi:hypothetical protein